MPDEIKRNIEIYEEVILKLCQLFKKMGISDKPIKIYESFRYMCFNGYLSSGNFSDSLPESFINIELGGWIPMDVTGSVVLANYGVCRHTTDFLSHIYSGLNYESSQLFLYDPDARVTVDNYGKGFLTNYHAQKYIDEAMKELDLFGKEKVSITRKYGDVVVSIDYYPTATIPNHTVNIVKKREEDRIYILDTRYHRIGEVIDEKSIILNDLGLTHIAFVDQNPFYYIYYDTDYNEGLRLLNNFDTQMDKDVLDSILCRERCKDYEDEFKAFKEENQRVFDLASDNFKRMIKRRI